MAFDRRFELGLLWRAGLVLLLFALLGLAIVHPGLGATRLLLALASAAAIAGLWQHVRRTNLAIARFVEAIRYDDHAQRFALGRGGGFDVLGASLDEVLRTVASRQSKAAEEARFLSAVIDDTPVALLTIDGDGQISLLNKAARRLFDRHQGVRLADFEIYGAEFAAALTLPPARRRLSRFMLDGVAQRVLIGSGRVDRLSGHLTIVSVLPIQQLLGAVEVAAQGDLVRVLTHEIMNSLTPVTSLARSAAALMDDASEGGALRDARAAIETLARRAEGLSRFVDSYRSFAQTPEVRTRRFDAGIWASEILRLCAADPQIAGTALSADVEAGTMIDGDPDLLAQVVINLLRNAATAARGHRAEPVVRLAVSRVRGGRTTISVEDNGPGIPIERTDDIFLPFYTTKAEGNGVGLSFARQVVVAHNGLIAAERSSDGGALLRIVI